VRGYRYPHTLKTGLNDESDSDQLPTFHSIPRFSHGMYSRCT
jgi:hypothetical protein